MKHYNFLHTTLAKQGQFKLMFYAQLVLKMAFVPKLFLIFNISSCSCPSCGGELQLTLCMITSIYMLTKTCNKKPHELQ